MRKWTPDIDPTTIPDEVLKAERARRNSAKRTAYGAGSGRPSVMRPCPKCGTEYSAVEMRKHRCGKTLAEVFAAEAEASNAR